MSFNQLSLHPAILKAIAATGYTNPTPIQEQAIPEIMAGHDLMASAQTGTGKTAAFILPALQRLSVRSQVRSRGPRILVLSPTRELANQINDAAERYGRFMRIRTGVVVGGMAYPPQYRLLSNELDILVATPGRLIDHIDQKRVDFSRVEMLVIDEADRMLDMGFINDVRTIVRATPTDRQTLLFSATLDARIKELAKDLLYEPKRIEIAPPQARHELIEQQLHHADDVLHKHKLLHHVLTRDSVDKAIVFTATKHGAERLSKKLALDGFRSAALHGGMGQGARNRTVEGLRRGKVRVLVATDVAARGIDIDGITHVVNFDLPRAAEDYVHRIGRTGRAQATGTAISLALPTDRPLVRAIERFTGQTIERHTVPGLEPRRPDEKREERPASKRPYKISNASTWDRKVPSSGWGGKKSGSGGKKSSGANRNRRNARISY